MAPASLLQNLMSAGAPIVTGTQVKRLQSAAMLDGVLEADERQVFTDLRAGQRVEEAARPGLDAWLASPSNPEVALMRKRSPHFDTKLAALAKHAQPGDLIFWRDPRGGDLAKWLGTWSHVSLVLEDGKLLDTMSLEGVSISTQEAVLAKVERRMQADAFAIGRPARRLTPAQLKDLGAAASKLQGRDYALVSKLANREAKLSCSRSVYEALAAVGIDLAPAGKRMVEGAVMPGDLMRGVKMVGVIDEAGAFKAGKKVAHEAWNISSLRKAVLKAYDWAFAHVPGIWAFAERYQARALRALRHV